MQRSYPFKCILPNDRILFYLNSSVVVSTDSKNDSFNSLVSTKTSDLHNFVAIYDKFDDESPSKALIPIKEIGSIFEFNYITHLQFFHEKDLRNYFTWGLDSSSPDVRATTSLPQQYSDQVRAGCMSNNLFSIRKVIIEDDMNVGFGLFLEEGCISKGTMIGEYVGVLLSKSSTCSDYSMLYPSCDGSYEIDSWEYGNLTRFINHSIHPNTVCQHVLVDEIIHIIIVSLIITPCYGSIFIIIIFIHH